MLRMKYAVNPASCVRDCIMLFTKRVLPLVSWFINDIDHDMCNSKPINVLKWYVGLNDLFTYLLQSKDDVDSF